MMIKQNTFRDCIGAEKFFFGGMVCTEPNLGKNMLCGGSRDVGY